MGIIAKSRRLSRDESVDGDQLSSDEQEDESSEASAGEASDDSFAPAKRTSKPKRSSTPSVDPATGLPGTPGRPSQVEAVAAPGDDEGAAESVSVRTGLRENPKKRTIKSVDVPPVQKRKRGRTKKSKDPAPGGRRKRGRGRPRKSIDPATGLQRKRGRPKKVVENDPQSDAASRYSAGKGTRSRPKKSETGTATREPSAEIEAAEEWRVDPPSTPHTPLSVIENGSGNGYRTKKGKGPSLSSEDDFVQVCSDTDEEGSVGGMPAISYDLDDDTADVAAVAAAVAAKAAEEGALGCSATPTRGDRDRPLKDSTPSGSPSLEWDGLA